MDAGARKFQSVVIKGAPCGDFAWKVPGPETPLQEREGPAFRFGVNMAWHVSGLRSAAACGVSIYSYGYIVVVILFLINVCICTTLNMTNNCYTTTTTTITATTTTTTTTTV